MNVATGGFGTEITAQTDEGLKDKLGGAAYLFTGKSSSHGCLWPSVKGPALKNLSLQTPGVSLSWCA